MSFPSVSVVIPTYGDQEVIVDAVQSALSQTVSPVEVVVASDGADPRKGDLLAALGDPRVRYVEAPHRRSASATRNYGITKARGDLVALLDDDDSWLPEKLDLQLRAYEQHGGGNLIVAGVEEIIALDGSSNRRPTKGFGRYRPEETLFRRGLGVHTSTLLAPTTLFRAFPFNESIERHEDWEWLLTAGRDVDLVIIPETIARRVLRPGEGLSRPGGFKFSKTWYLANKSRMSKRTRSFCVTGVLSRKAAYDRNFTALPWLLCEHARTASLRPNGYLEMAAHWVLPNFLKTNIKRLKKLA